VTSLGFGIKLPFYFSSINCALAILQILNAFTNGNSVEICTISYYAIESLLGLHLFLGMVIVITTSIDLNKKSYTAWGYKEYKLWLSIALPSVLLTFAGLNYYNGIEWCNDPYRYKLMTWMTITNITIMSIVVILTSVYYIKLRLNLKKLKKEPLLPISLNESNQSKQAFDRRNVIKILSYINVYLLQWIVTLAYVITRLIKYDVESNNDDIYDWLRFILITAIFIGSIGNIIQFLRNERLRYKTVHKKGSGNSQTTAQVTKTHNRVSPLTTTATIA
jgi:hypothetical protein